MMNIQLSINNKLIFALALHDKNLINQAEYWFEENWDAMVRQVGDVAGANKVDIMTEDKKWSLMFSQDNALAFIQGLVFGVMTSANGQESN